MALPAAGRGQLLPDTRISGTHRGMPSWVCVAQPITPEFSVTPFPVRPWPTYATWMPSPTTLSFKAAAGRVFARNALNDRSSSSSTFSTSSAKKHHAAAVDVPGVAAGALLAETHVEEE